MQEIKEILKDKIFNDIRNGYEKMSEESVEFLKNNFYLWFGGEADRIYSMFKVVYSVENNEIPFNIKISKEFLFGYRRHFIASNVLTYLDFIDYCKVIDGFTKEGDDFFNYVESDEKEIHFIYDPSSKAVNVATTLHEIKGGNTND